MLGSPNHELLIRTLEVQLTAFAVCEIGKRWRLKAGSMSSTVIHFVLAGNGFFETETDRIQLGPKTVLLVPSGISESITGSGDVAWEASAARNCRALTEGLVTFSAHGGSADLVLGCASLSASFGCRQSLFDHLKEPIVLSMDEDRLSSIAFDCLLEEVSSPRLATTAVIEALMKQIMVILLRNQLEQLGADSPLFVPLADARLLRAVSAIIAHPEQPHTPSSLAAVAGMSRSSFAARFSQAYGRTPGDLLQEVRLGAAAKMLGTCELPVKIVAATVGYSSRSHFSRIFKEAYGIDPTAFRTQLATERIPMLSDVPRSEMPQRRSA